MVVFLSSSFTASASLEEGSSAGHLVSVLGLGALPHGVSLALCDLLLLLVVYIEAISLIGCKRQLVFASDFALHALVLEAVIAHLSG